jgi:uridine kinase
LTQTPTLTRLGLVDLLSGAIASRQLPYPTRVAVDGPDTAGKSTLADELADRLCALGRAVVRASIDGFHRPRDARYRRGRLSPEGYYEESFDLQALQELLLEPLGPEGSREYRAEVFDYMSDSPIVKPVTRAPRDAVLVFDGVFLLRPELDRNWDVRIHLQVAEDEILRRARQRDGVRLASPAEVNLRYQKRYLPAQRVYAARVRPADLADFVIGNDNPAAPLLARTLRV